MVCGRLLATLFHITTPRPGLFPSVWPEFYEKGDLVGSWPLQKMCQHIFGQITTPPRASLLVSKASCFFHELWFVESNFVLWKKKLTKILIFKFKLRRQHTTQVCLASFPAWTANMLHDAHKFSLIQSLTDWWLLVLLVKAIQYPCLRVYVAQIHVDLSSRFFEFLPESNRRSRN